MLGIGLRRLRQALCACKWNNALSSLRDSEHKPPVLDQRASGTADGRRRWCGDGVLELLPLNVLYQTWNIFGRDLKSNAS
ncbi:hypothetical protein EVAR_16016_1 [Eumeta japonica]|uniref:Uncharacterized protein n=1 Tax=Eumeta variegata TaxID=151549 RepID=A0A4C1VYP3_EUMVA|nr:hypothetical protein EVAR_16016_1 [Eumeta japonica]